MNPNLPKENLRQATKALKAANKISSADELRLLITDSLTAFMHLCDVAGLNYSELQSKAHVHYRFEAHCARCSAKLTGKDAAKEVDNFCQKCLKALGKNFTWISNHVP